VTRTFIKNSGLNQNSKVKQGTNNLDLGQNKLLNTTNLTLKS
jgi:hypothetical protein